MAEEQQHPRREWPDYRVEVRHEFSHALIDVLERIAAGLGTGSGTAALDRIERKLDKMTEETKQILVQIDTETTRIAEAIEDLVAASNDTELKAGLESHLARLKGIAHDPNQPIPPA